MRVKLISIGLCVWLFSGCAQVPKESVELSTTIGRDIAVTQDAHAQLAELFFARMKHDVNRFVDNVYAPYQINNAMVKQQQLASSNDPAEKRKSLLLAINAAFKEGASEELQNKTLKGMESLITKIRDDIEDMRSELLTPLIEQEKQVLDSINRAYQQMHYANSIVTGHLSSVVKVHDTQADLLEEFGVERNLREDIGVKIANTSNKITSIVDTAENIDIRTQSAASEAESLKSVITQFGSAL